MSANVLSFSTPDDDLAVDPETDDLNVDGEPESQPEVVAEPEPEPPTPPAALAPLPIVDVLPADFPLPALIKFVPNPQLRIAADQAGTYALGLQVDGAEGLQRADVALQAVRASLKAIDEVFAEPTDIANSLHKRLTSMRGEWKTRGQQAIETVGRRIADETHRLARLAAEERRKVQEEADRLAREAIRRQAEEAERQQAPATVVQELQRQAETATAPPVSVATPSAPPVLAGNTVVKTWKSRIAGTPGSDEPNPEMTALTPAQREQIFIAMRAVLEGKAPLAMFAIDWSFLNNRAKSDKSTFAIPGFEAFEQGSTRAKSTRR